MTIDADIGGPVWVATKLNELRSNKGVEYVDLALQAAEDSLKVETLSEYQGRYGTFVRCFGSVGVEGKVVEIDEIAQVSAGHRKADYESSLKKRGARAIVFLEEGIVDPPVPA